MVGAKMIAAQKKVGLKPPDFTAPPINPVIVAKTAVNANSPNTDPSAYTEASGDPVLFSKVRINT